MEVPPPGVSMVQAANNSLANFTPTYPLLNQSVTSMHQLVPYQHPPNLRGTMDIVWGCLAVLFTAIYVSEHPDLSYSFDWTRLRFKQGKIENWIAKPFVALFFAAYPESLLHSALGDYLHCKALYNRVHQLLPDLSEQRWSISHAYVVNMHGVSLRFADGSSRALTAETFLYLVENDLIDMDLFPTATEIDDKSKADPLVKAIACIQLCWLLAQVIARAIEKLPVSQLELMTSAYAAITLVVYFLWLRKPYRMSVPFPLPYPSVSSNLLFDNKIESGKESASVRSLKPQNDLIYFVPHILSLLFGAVHFLAWNFPFPTIKERDIWRMSAKVFIGLVVGHLIFDFLCHKNVIRWGLVEFFVGLAQFCHGLLRLLFVGLTLASMRAFPAGSYIQPSWTALIPHFS